MKKTHYSGGTRNALESKSWGDSGAGWETLNPRLKWPNKQPSPSRPPNPKPQRSYRLRYRLPAKAVTASGGGTRRCKLLFFKLYQIPFSLVCVSSWWQDSCILSPFHNDSLSHCPQKTLEGHPVLCCTNSFQRNPSAVPVVMPLRVLALLAAPTSHPKCRREPEKGLARPSRGSPSLLPPPPPPLPPPSFWLCSLVAFSITEQLGGIQLRFRIGY